ncbi:hypothetical protein BD324DRAFT_651144 [Kockovaella imperatae]|uniref:SET domain-containing protein n=1 Tax=Kockovaella imperatae TaxID=4999 RepID=A0A1Y1UF67_9TREE|nr:hypothetical protein BD324DRAFT_651144 [Kockovaella imperatae]ORX36658.1 hypothetical protein BD324DRAFT_651144 [Kockovaella imperatae]
MSQEHRQQSAFRRQIFLPRFQNFERYKSPSSDELRVGPAPSEKAVRGWSGTLASYWFLPRPESTSMPFVKHDAQPPASWPTETSYLVKCRLSPTFPSALHSFLFDKNTVSSPAARYNPRPVIHPSHLSIKVIKDPGHPANGQAGLFTKRKIPPGELVIPYLGVIHHSLVADADSDVATIAVIPDEHEHSDYDLSLVRISAHDPLSPFFGYHVSIGVDAAHAGNAARFVNDYRGISSEPNAEFCLGHGAAGELRMEIWSLKKGIAKGEEVLVSYGKSWWSARKP